MSNQLSHLELLKGRLHDDSWEFNANRKIERVRLFEIQSTCEHIWEKTWWKGENVKGKIVFHRKLLFPTVRIERRALSIRKS